MDETTTTNDPTKGGKTMATFVIYFGECEHGGDLEHYRHAVKGICQVIDGRVNEAAEEGSLTVKFNGTKSQLWDALRRTEARGFYHSIIAK